MNKDILEERLTAIETAVAHLENMVDDLNSVLIEQSAKIERLSKQNSYLLRVCQENDIKPLSEETPPPHY